MNWKATILSLLGLAGMIIFFGKGHEETGATPQNYFFIISFGLAMLGFLINISNPRRRHQKNPE
ncbi:MAG: hypothetical protein AAB681_00510 [Patescibacteria group bacterium]